VTAKAERFDFIYANDRNVLKACASLRMRGINPI